MEIKSSLINDPDLINLKNSLINVSAIDDNGDFRVKLVEYVNDSSSNEQDDFFFDMVEFIRFLNPKENEDHVAYTDPNHLIWLNAPNKVVKNLKQWDFVYDHECLHQLWDTFGVEDRIVKENGSCDHFLLNIASDCVINDYLSRYRKKESPDGLITPDYLKSTYNIDYNSKDDTQYSLYLKLKKAIDENKDLKDKMQQDDRLNDPNFGDKKLTPKSVSKQNGPSNVPPMPNGKHSDDFIKGWVDAIKDALDKKVDPLKYKPKKAKNDYDEGYNSAMDNMKQGLEKGVQLSDSSNSGGNTGDLPNIPWDLPKNDQSNSDKSGDSDDSSNKSNSDSSNGKSSDKSPEENSSNAQKSADSASDDAKAAKDIADKKSGGKDGDKMKKAAENAASAAKEAQDAADRAKKAAENHKKAVASGDSKEADKAKKEAAAAADDAAAKAAKAKDALNQAKEAAGMPTDKDSDKKSNNAGGKGAGTEEADSNVTEDYDKSRLKAEEIIKKHANKISGPLGEFLNKIRSSVKLQESGLAITTMRGVASWNEILEDRVNAYVKNRIWQKKRIYQSTYSRVKRGSGFIKYGEPINPGKKIKEEKLTINVAFFIDRSGSMSVNNCIDHAFDAAYEIAEGLKKKYSRESVVGDFSYKMCVFDTSIKEINWGRKIDASGGTCALQDIFKYIENNSKDYLVNIIITDGEFSDVNTAEVESFIKKLDGLFIFVTNGAQDQVEEIAKNHKSNTKFIKASADFALD